MYLGSMFDNREQTILNTKLGMQFEKHKTKHFHAVIEPRPKRM